MTPTRIIPIVILAAIIARVVVIVACWALSFSTSFDNTNASLTLLENMIMLNNLHISARRWFQKTYGNTYHSVRIFANGEEIANLPYQYGYGEQWLQTALDYLREKGLIEPQQYYSNGCGKFYETQYLRETLHGTYEVADVNRKRDL